MVSGMDHATGECAVRIGIDSLSMTQCMAPPTTLGTDLGQVLRTVPELISDSTFSRIFPLPGLQELG
jgi:hypothetical protein